MKKAAITVLIALLLSGCGSNKADISAQGGPVAVRQEDDVRRLRRLHEVLKRREEILQTQIFAAQVHPDDPEALRRARTALVELIRQRQETEDRLVQYFEQIWESRARARIASIGTPSGTIALAWPIEPTLGISAGFDDPAYLKRFGIPHLAVDIPANQGTIISAPAEGVVEIVADNGLGYSYLILRHEGFATLYGHPSEFLVVEGQYVRTGEPIARSGGSPGTAGAGPLSTGPHLHFELTINAEHVDPLPYLPSL